MTDMDKIKKVVIFGSGPIVIGQACEFDYSGTQACKALMGLGLEVVLINSNPATIMTDPDLATKVYVEPLKAPFVRKILEAEKPDAIIPTLGGQTALNLALELDADGTLKELDIRMLGSTRETIEAAEDREKFRALLDRVGGKYCRSELVRNFADGIAAGKDLGFPIILRPNYTLGGGGGGIAYSQEEYERMLANALQESPTSEVLVEESILGWKEYELEVMRDKNGTFVVICSIENFDPCGVHTGDSITIAPQQTLTDRQYQDMRDEARKIVDAVGLETGGANIQFAVNPDNGERIVIEMNPRVSRSSALASKATGFPIAKIAALVAMGHTLDEITNDITKTTPSCYEPALDYVVTKIPRFAFEKFEGTKDLLTTQMKSVGEVMSIGRTFKESLGKAISSLENYRGFEEVQFDEELISYPNSQRIFHIAQAFRDGKSVDDIHQLCQVNHWFLEQLKDIIDCELEIKKRGLNPDNILLAKRYGISDMRLADVCGLSEKEVRNLRVKHGVRPGYLRVDTCAGEFKSETPYFYSTYWSRREKREAIQDTVAILGSGPNRIGQGIEFDYSCVRGVKKFRSENNRVVMINTNPETVSTDYDTSDELFFEPLNAEYVAEVLDYTQPKGFVAQLGGQTPITIANDLVAEGYQILGSDLQTIDLAEDRALFSNLCQELNFKIPKAGIAGGINEALKIAQTINYPIMVRPSYVLGGRRMEVVENEEELRDYFTKYDKYISAPTPCLMDEFLENALEVDVDLVRGVDWVVIGGIVEHIEAAGVHSGDSMGVLPPQKLKVETTANIEKMSIDLANKMNIIGHLNLQLAVKNDQVYMIEANPRSSRSVPFVAKASRVPVVDLAVMAMLGYDKARVQPEKYDWAATEYVSVKGVVFPFKKFRDSDSILGPEMKSTGECMGRGKEYSDALLKALISSQNFLPKEGEVFLSLRDKDKDILLSSIKQLSEMGYSLTATSGTAKYLKDHGLNVEVIKKVHEGRPHCVDRIRSGDIALVINTTSGRRSIEASFGIRRSCIDYSVPCITERQAALATILALRSQRDGTISVSPLEKMI